MRFKIICSRLQNKRLVTAIRLSTSFSILFSNEKFLALFDLCTLYVSKIEYILTEIRHLSKNNK